MSVGFKIYIYSAVQICVSLSKLALQLEVTGHVSHRDSLAFFLPEE